MTKLTAAERESFLRLSRECADPDQLKRITARLQLNRFVLLHGKEACQSAWDEAKRRGKKKCL